MNGLACDRNSWRRLVRSVAMQTQSWLWLFPSKSTLIDPQGLSEVTAVSRIWKVVSNQRHGNTPRQICVGILTFLAALSWTLPSQPASAGNQRRETRAVTPCVALTFDDGPDATLTPLLLDILAREKVHATFFVVGKRLAYSPGLVRRAFLEGHEIGNHTFDHRALTELTDGEAIAEVEMTDEAVIAETGHVPDVLRPPWGKIDARIETALRGAGLWRRIVFWNFDSFDWLDDEAPLTKLIGAGAPAGAVILMHDIHASTIEAVPDIIHTLKMRGFRFATVGQLQACRNGMDPGAVSAAPPAGSTPSHGWSSGSFAHIMDGITPLREYFAHRLGS